MIQIEEQTIERNTSRGGARALFRLLLVALIAVGSDSLSKTWAEQALIPAVPVPVVGDIFRLTLGHNAGVAFGLFAGGGPWLLITGSAIILSLVGWLSYSRCLGTAPAAAWPLGLIFGGAAANLADRWSDGRVTDLLDLGIGSVRWPTFNLADVFIVVGIGLLLCLSFRERPPSETHW